jgi:hypothetical protein
MFSSILSPQYAADLLSNSSKQFGDRADQHQHRVAEGTLLSAAISRRQKQRGDCRQVQMAREF